MTNTSSNTDAKKKPIYRKQMPGGISVGVFLNDYQGRTYRSVNLQRSYRDRDGKWQNRSIFIEHGDILHAIAALNGAFQFLTEGIAAYGTSDAGDEPDAAPAEAPAEAAA